MGNPDIVKSVKMQIYFYLHVIYLLFSGITVLVLDIFNFHFYTLPEKIQTLMICIFTAKLKYLCLKTVYSTVPLSEDIYVYIPVASIIKSVHIWCPKLTKIAS